MEGNFRSDTPQPTASLGYANELNLSNSEVSSLTAENCKDIFRHLANVPSDDFTAWTDEKHNLYLNHLEVSFVTQLHKSRGLVPQCSEQNLRDKNISQKNASEKYGCWQKINHVKGECVSRPSADSHNPHKNPWIYHFKHIEMHSPSSSADMQGYLKLCNHRLATRSHRLSASRPYHCDFFDLKKEGTGQNFVDEDNHKSNIKSQQIG